jgi:hypothetical protein
VVFKTFAWIWGIWTSFFFPLGPFLARSNLKNNEFYFILQIFTCLTWKITFPIGTRIGVGKLLSKCLRHPFSYLQSFAKKRNSKLKNEMILKVLNCKKWEEGGGGGGGRGINRLFSVFSQKYEKIIKVL